MTRKKKHLAPWETARIAEMQKEMRSLNDALKTVKQESHLRLAILKRLLSGEVVDSEMMSRVVQYVANNGTKNHGLRVRDGEGDGVLEAGWLFEEMRDENRYSVLVVSPSGVVHAVESK